MGRGVPSTAEARSVVISSSMSNREEAAHTDQETSPPTTPSSPDVLRTLSVAHGSAARRLKTQNSLHICATAKGHSSLERHNSSLGDSLVARGATDFLFSCVLPRVHEADDDVITRKQPGAKGKGKGNGKEKRSRGISKARTAPSRSLESPTGQGEGGRAVGKTKSLDKDSLLDRSRASTSTGSSSKGRGASSRRLSSSSLGQEASSSLSASGSTESSLPGSPVRPSASAENGCATAMEGHTPEHTDEMTGDIAEELDYVLSREDTKTHWETTASFFHNPSSLPLPRLPAFLSPFLAPQDLDHVNVRKGKPNFSQFYRLGATLGVGGYGTVKDCVHVRTGETLACKVVRKDIFPDQKLLLRARLESQLQDLVSPHPHIVQAKQLFEDDKHLYLVMEKCSGGDLFTFMEQHAPLPESKAASLLSQIVSALRACHDEGVLHRDLKLENVLLTKPVQNGPKVQLKLGDFGAAVLLPPGKRAVGQVGGSMMYQAPEVLSGKKYDYKADIWSLGVILYAMLVGSFPFSAPTEGLLGGMIKRGVLRTATPEWYRLSSDARNAVMGMLQVDPSKRASIGDISFHPWILRHSPKGQARARTLSS